jgi:hypothetical protein|tara:strand:+ start:296 stop:595 length:300 start_codon:yes stop_codon:yes gene_type:complete
MKKVILIGFPNPVKLKSKRFIIETLYKRAKKNPFLSEYSYDEYLEFLINQIDSLSSTKVDIDRGSDTLERDIYNALKKLNWLKVINGLIVGIITTNIGV